MWLDSLTKDQKAAIRSVVLEKGHSFELPRTLSGLRWIRDNTDKPINLQWDEKDGWVMMEP